MREVKKGLCNELYKIWADEETDGDPDEYNILQNGDKDDKILGRINFQAGPIQVAGVNGIQVEDLLKICIDRLEIFQSRLYPCQYNCQYNKYAIEACKAALDNLDERTKDRLLRGAEGRSEK